MGIENNAPHGTNDYLDEQDRQEAIYEKACDKISCLDAAELLDLVEDAGLFDSLVDYFIKKESE